MGNAEFKREESWRPVDGHPGYYVSTFGRVVSRKRGGTKEMKLSYCGPKSSNRIKASVALYTDGKATRIQVNRLVLKTFNPVENADGLQVYHKDGNPNNNKLENLEWREWHENDNYEVMIEAVGKARNHAVRCVETGQEFDTIAEASRVIGVSRTSIAKAAKGEIRRAGGLHWKFIDGQSNEYTCKAVRCVELDKVYESVVEAARDIGVAVDNIYQAIHGRSNTAAGFTWKYCDEPEAKIWN